MIGWVSVAVVAATLALMLIRPRGIAEAWVAAGGAVVMLLIGAVHLADVTHVLRETADVLLFLLGMMVLTGLAERAGVFARMAEGCAWLARGSGWLLFVNVFVLGAIVTALLSLDVTVLTLTPIVYALAIRRRLDALPFMFACTFVANTASLLLPISNLTNLLVYSQLHIGFATYAARMWLPSLAAVAVNLGVFLWLFRDRLPHRFDQSPQPLEDADWWLITAGTVLAATLVALFALGLAGLPLSIGALAGGGVLLAIALGGRRARLSEVAHGVSWPLFVFVVGMFLVVRGFEHAWLADLTTGLPTHRFAALLTGVVGGTLGSNIVNNVPMTVLALSLVPRAAAGTRDALAYGTLVGVNIGPTLTTYGSLATMLWLALVRKRGLDVTTADYMKVGAATMPPVLVAAALTLWLVLR